MSKKRVRLTLLCEDRQHEAFFRRFLSIKGYSSYEIRTEKAPHARGSGEQYVREAYNKQVKILRSRSYITSIGLLVVIDVDDKTVEYRHRQLDEVLDNKREPHERIFIATPKRNIETWIHYLDDNPVTEEKIYPRLTGSESKCRKAAEKLAEIISELPADAPDALKKSAEEIKRIFT
jgi:hypothetical protein